MIKTKKKDKKPKFIWKYHLFKKKKCKKIISNQKMIKKLPFFVLIMKNKKKLKRKLKENKARILKGMYY